MSNRRPAKLLPVKFNLRSALPPDPNGRVYQYNAQLTMANPQRHSSVVHGNKQYTLEDLLVGDYVSTTGNGRIMKIVTINDVTPYDAQIVVEDDYRLNQIQDSSGDNIPWIESQNGIVFEVVEGKPVLFPYTEYSTAVIGFVKDYAAELFSRFNYLRQHTLVDIYQAGHTFAVGDIITWSLANGWSLMGESDNYLGVVIEINEPYSGWFRFRPNGEVLDLELSGTGPEFYWDPLNPGKLTETIPLAGERYVLAFYKLSDRQAIFFTNNPALDFGSSFVTIGTDQTITGDKDFTGEVSFSQTPSFTNLDVQSAQVRDLTNNRLVIAGINGELEDDPNLTFNGTQLNVGGNITATSATVSNLSDSRIVIVDGYGDLSDNPNLTFSSNILTVGGDLSVTGDFVVSGTTTTVDTDNTVITDRLIELNQGYTGPPMVADSGIIINRGPEDNLFFGWDEDDNVFTAGTGTFDGSTTGNLTLTDAPVRFGSLTLTSDLTVNGNVVLGDSDTDNITVGGEFLSHLIPNADELYDLGTETKKWNKLWSNELYVETSISGSGTVAFTTGKIELNNQDNTNVNHSMYVLYGNTTDAVQTELYLNASSERISISNNSTLMFEADIIGRDQAGSDHCAFKIQGIVDNTGSTVVVVNNTNETIVAQTNDTWSVQVTADSINDAINVFVTGAAATNIRWVAFVKTTQISF